MTGGYLTYFLNSKQVVTEFILAIFIILTKYLNALIYIDSNCLLLFELMVL